MRCPGHSSGCSFPGRGAFHCKPCDFAANFASSWCRRGCFCGRRGAVPGGLSYPLQQDFSHRIRAQRKIGIVTGHGIACKHYAKDLGVPYDERDTLIAQKSHLKHMCAAFCVGFMRFCAFCTPLEHKLEPMN